MNDNQNVDNQKIDMIVKGTCFMIKKYFLIMDLLNELGKIEEYYDSFAERRESE